MGHDVFDIDEQTFIPQVSMFTSRVGRRLLWPRFVAEFNKCVVREANTFNPDILLAFKGTFLYPETLRAMRERGIALYNYFPDTSAFAHGKWLPKSLPEYDCVFYTKPFWYADVTKRIPLKAGYFLPHGYDPLLHRPVTLSPSDKSEYGCDVSFIAFHTLYKEQLLHRLKVLRPDLNLRVWGLGWNSRCKSDAVRPCIQGFPLFGDRYTRAIQSSKINLAIMSGRVTGSSSGDLTTSRTYTIPASGGFMLHERNSEVLGLYREGKEIVCFDSPEELAEKIDYYLAHPDEREAIARAGHARCVPAYSYDNRMAELLQWHFEHARTPNSPEVHSRIFA